MGHNIIRQYKSNELYYFSDAEKELIIKEYLSYQRRSKLYGKNTQAERKKMV
ncbi:MAG: hypothetical protein IPJ81_09130 [Chitinophagaceae bacterium]|nr:hypothetical protein [Chitinophagaceae bacterium]